MTLNVQVIVSTFIMIFLAELGDKTQLSTFAFASESKSSLSVFIGAASALILTSFLAVVLGGLLGRIIPERIMKVVAGILFLGFGFWSIAEAIRG